MSERSQDTRSRSITRIAHWTPPESSSAASSVCCSALRLSFEREHADGDDRTAGAARDAQRRFVDTSRQSVMKMPREDRGPIGLGENNTYCA